MNVTFARIACVLLPLAAAACGGVDPTQLSGRHNVVDETAPADGMPGDPAADPNAAAPGASNGTAAGSSGTNGTSAGTDAGAGPEGGTDSGSSATPPPPPNAFTGAGAFVSQLGPSTRKSSHNFPNNTPTTSPKGQACSNCHNFFIGGTVFADAAGTTPAAGVEVRARNASGVAVSAWTDQDGNFYLANSGGVTLPANIGVRNATTVKPMSSSIGSGTCASSACHVVGKQGPIHLP